MNKSGVIHIKHAPSCSGSTNDRLNNWRYISFLRLGIGVIVGAIFGIGLFFGVGQFLSPDSIEQAIKQQSVSSVGNHQSSSLLLGQLKNLLKVDGPATRFREFQVLTEQLSDTTLVEVLSSSLEFRHRKLYTLQLWLLEKIARSNIALALEQVAWMPREHWERNIEVVLNQQPSLRLSEAFEIAKTLNEPFQITFVKVSLSNIKHHSDNDLIRQAREHGYEHIASQVLEERKTLATALNNPLLALRQLQQDAIENSSQIDLVKAILTMLLDTPQTIEFSTLMTLLDDIYPDNNSTFDEFIGELAEFAPVEVWQQMLNLPYKLQIRIQRIAIEALLEKDLELAWRMISELSRPAFRADSGNWLVHEWAARDSEHLLSIIDVIPVEFRTAGIQSATLDLAQKGDYETAARQLTKLKSQGELVDRSMQTLVLLWAKEDPQTASDWTLTTTEDDLDLRQVVLDRFVLAEMAMSKPNLAMQIAQQLPDSGSRHSAPDAWVIGGLASEGRFEEARRQLGDVRESMKTRAQFALGSNLMDFGMPDEALELAEQMSSSEAEDYVTRVAYIWYLNNPLQLLERFDQLPSEPIRDAVARQILRGLKYATYQLSDEQVSYLERFIQLDLDE